MGELVIIGCGEARAMSTLAASTFPLVFSSSPDSPHPRLDGPSVKANPSPRRRARLLVPTVTEGRRG